MSADYYHELGLLPINKFTQFDSASAASLWPQTASTRVVITSMTICTNLAGTFLVSLGNVGGTKIAMFTLNASTMISPDLGDLDAGVMDRTFFGTPSIGETGGWTVYCQGFELKDGAGL